MPPSINWATKRITVPQSDLTLLSGVLYELNVNDLRLDLKDIEDSEEGVVFDATHNHNTQVTLSGVTYARTFELINGYTLDFQDTGSPYTVSCVGANHNIADVFVAGTTQVSLIIGNSAGLIVVSSGSGLSSEQDASLTAIKAKTDQLTISAGLVDANVEKMNQAEVIGTGTTGDSWRGVGVSP